MAGRKKKTGSRIGRKDHAPTGFTKIESPHMAGFWVPEIVGQQVRGIVGETINGVGRDGNPNTYILLLLTDNESGPVIGVDEKKRKHRVDVGEGQMIGVGGAVLLSLLRGREGKEILARYIGLGPKKPGKSPPRMFDVFERDE